MSPTPSAGALTRRRVSVAGLVVALALASTPTAAQAVKQTRVSFQSGNAQRDGYALAGLDIAYVARTCSGAPRVIFGVVPGSIDVEPTYWFEGHAYPVLSGWPGPQTESYTVRVFAMHGAERVKEWDSYGPSVTQDLRCGGSAPFVGFGGWDALLGDRAQDPTAQEHALASLALDTPFDADRPLRNREVEALIRRGLREAEAAPQASHPGTDAETDGSEGTVAQAGEPAPDLQARGQDARLGEAEEAEARRRSESERRWIETERQREAERQAAVAELGDTMGGGLIAGVAVAAYADLPSAPVEGVAREYGLRFGQIDDQFGFLFGFGANDTAVLTGTESSSNQLVVTVGGEVGVAPPGLGLSKAFMPFVGAYYKSVEFYADPVYDQEEESWDVWGFSLGFMGSVGDLLVYQAGLKGDLDTPEINYMRGGDAGFFLALGFQFKR